jgi:putative FmdB family regulatory protein
MPSYLLHCRGCLKPFTEQSSRHDYEQGDIVCPFCGSSDVERQVSRFYDAASNEERLMLMKPTRG